jgi:hypothetical protein
MAIITGYIDWNTGERNARFSFRVNNKADALKCIQRLQKKGSSVRAAWYVDYKRMISPARI